jgi:hypothetical protein
LAAPSNATKKNGFHIPRACAWVIAKVVGNACSTNLEKECPMKKRIKTVDAIYKTNPCIVVEGPAWGDAKLYGKWLLAAAKAEVIWKDAYADQDFRKQIDRLCVSHIPDFGIAATAMTMRLRENLTTFVWIAQTVTILP